MPSRKQACFALFDEGLSPSSPEVQALRLKSSTRASYYWEWKNGRGGKSSESPSGEHLGSINETKKSETKSTVSEQVGSIDEANQLQIKANPKETEAKSEESSSQEIPSLETEPEEGDEETEASNDEKDEVEDPAPSGEGVGVVNEAGGKEKKGKDKGEAIILGEGVKCVVLLSKATLALHEIAATKHAQLSKNGKSPLLLGDFLDTCVENFFKDRNLRLGLVDISE